MSYFLFPNFYIASAWHAVQIFYLQVKWGTRFAYLSARMAFWTHLGERFKKFEKGE